MLKGFKGCSKMSMSVTTKVKLNKKSRVTKISSIEAFGGDVFSSYRLKANYNVNYENSVNNQLAREGKEKTFNALSLPWGEWLEGEENKIIAHKNNFYLRYYPTS